MRSIVGVFLMLCLGFPLLADEVKWGEPVNGLRIGLVNAPTSATSDQHLTFKVIAENVSKQPITLPTPDTFMLKTNPQSNDYHESPLTPVIVMVRTGPSDVMGPETNISVRGLPSDLASKTAVTLAPGKSVTWDPVFLEKYFYFGDHLPAGDKTTIEVWPLLPNFMYHIRFRFRIRPVNWMGTIFGLAKRIPA